MPTVALTFARPFIQLDADIFAIWLKIITFVNITRSALACPLKK